jgi:peroxiredoxin Q/BCP
MTLQAGDAAPDFTLPRDGGQMLALAGLKGRKVVLYAYPKDDTPGCTQEAIAFNALRKEFAAADTEIVGISPDPVKSHDKFTKKHGLDFALAADETQDVLKAYGIWVEKSMYGRSYMGVERTTFLIDRDGRIARIWPKVKVAGHAEEVLAAAQAL